MTTLSKRYIDYPFEELRDSTLLFDDQGLIVLPG
jgi:hypothetical protein